MRIDLIPSGGKYYRANLHCHTTVSDGQFTPAEIKAMYKKKGYSVIAYTDHRKMLDHSDFNDEDFLALTSFEMDFTEDDARDFRYKKCCHINLISPEAHKELTEPARIPYEPSAINAYIRSFKEKGFLVHYNHPEWSMEDQNDYDAYEGFDGMEIYNNTCYVMGFHEENAIIYERMLKKHGNLHCLATDDNHALIHCFGGYTMIKAPELSYDAIFNALKEGHFYASWGAAIDEVYVEDGELHVTTPGAREIAFTTGVRSTARFKAEGSEPLTHASFPINQNDIFIKAEVIDFDGRRAYTNAYFVK